jgi:hypothetical protein
MKYTTCVCIIIILCAGCKKKGNEVSPLSYAPKLAGERTWSIQVDYTLSYPRIYTSEHYGHKDLAITIMDEKHISVAGTNLTFQSIQNNMVIYRYSSGVPDWIDRTLSYAYKADSVYYSTMGYDIYGGRYDTIYRTHL